VSSWRLRIVRLWRFYTAAPPEGKAERRSRLRRDAVRLTQVLLGLVSIGFAIVVLAQPVLSLSGLVVLLGEAVALFSAQTILASGRFLSVEQEWLPGTRSVWRRIRSYGTLGVGLVALGLAAFAVLDPALALTTAVFALALALVTGALGRILQSAGENLPPWRRMSALATGLSSVVLVGLSVAFYGYALAAFAILVGVILLISGIETVVAGLRPTDPRQFVLLKLVLFSAFYGLILINWIDLFGKQVPAYGLWLILTYMAPFGVLIVFEGWRSWPLAASLGLLVSLFNDVGYFFVGNLIFGFHENLGPWISGQLGLEGPKVVTIFQGGAFTLDVSSWLMGFSIYARAAVVTLILYYWWRHPSAIVAATSPPPAASPG
jgi:uncharacterized membrane protein HdeD (DUF308 family)